MRRREFISLIGGRGPRGACAAAGNIGDRVPQQQIGERSALAARSRTTPSQIGLFIKAGAPESLRSSPGKI
jgi:hypothetical protein